MLAAVFDLDDMSLSVRLIDLGIDMFLCIAGPCGVGASSRETCLDKGVLAFDCTVMVEAAEGRCGR